jgi:hypothetical protein
MLQNVKSLCQRPVVTAAAILSALRTVITARAARNRLSADPGRSGAHVPHAIRMAIFRIADAGPRTFS